MMGWICAICGSSNSPALLHCVCTDAPSAPSAPPASGAAPGADGQSAAAAALAAAPSADVVASKASKAKHRKARTYDLPGWVEFWNAYPQKLDKAKAYDAYADAVAAGAEPLRLISAAQKYATYCRINGIEPRHIKYAQGWLNAERWNDEIQVPAAVGETDPAQTVGTPEYEARMIAEGVW